MKGISVNAVIADNRIIPLRHDTEMKTLRRTKALPNVRLKGYREALGLTQKQLADATGYSQSVIAKLEAGDTRTTADHAARLAPRLGRQPQELFPSDGGPTVPVHNGATMELAVRIARRLAGDQEYLRQELTAVLYTILLYSGSTRIVLDDERVLSTLGDFISKLKQHYQIT